MWHDFHPLDARSAPTPVMTTKNVSRHCRRPPQLKTLCAGNSHLTEPRRLNGWLCDARKPLCALRGSGPRHSGNQEEPASRLSSRSDCNSHSCVFLPSWLQVLRGRARIGPGDRCGWGRPSASSSTSCQVLPLNAEEIIITKAGFGLCLL